MAWLMVIVAGVFETGFAVLLKQSHGITRLWPTVGFAICALISFALLTTALKKLEVGPAYAVWTGLGAGSRNPLRPAPPTPAMPPARSRAAEQPSRSLLSPGPTPCGPPTPS
jgi:hypothetical protein